MGGEMMYIIQQRLTAQNIDQTKADKVINDVLISMYSEGLVNEVFKKQQLLSVQFVKQMFEKLAHSSIMKLNEQSMNKLYDLMVMVFKYQVVAISSPHDLLQITENHFMSLTNMANSETAKTLIDRAKEQFYLIYTNMNCSQLQDIRYTLMTFLQDIKTRVSIFLREGVQEGDGNFIIKQEGTVGCECQIPGGIRYFDGEEKLVGNVTFESGCRYEFSEEKTSLGMNIYIKEVSPTNQGNTKSQQSITSENQSLRENDLNEEQDEDDASLLPSIANQIDRISTKAVIKKEMEILRKLIGRVETKEQTQRFYLSFENEDDNGEKSENTSNESKQSGRKGEHNELNINITQEVNKTKQLMSELSMNKSKDGECDDEENGNHDNNDDTHDLLALMDS